MFRSEPACLRACACACVLSEMCGHACSGVWHAQTQSSHPRMTAPMLTLNKQDTDLVIYSRVETEILLFEHCVGSVEKH